MNAVLLITKYNVANMATLATEIAESQIAANSGKLLVCGAIYIDKAVLVEIARSLEACFEVTEITTVQLSENQEEHTQVASMLATFLMQRYTSVPGAWVIFDDYASIIYENPLTLLEKAHNSSSADNSGRASSQGGGRVAVGPLVLGATARQLKTLRSTSGESWRQRGRWALNVASWNQMSADEYPFRLVKEIADPAISSELSPPSLSFEVSVTDVSLDPAPGSKSGGGGTDKAGMQSVAMPESHEEGSSDSIVERAALAGDSTPQEIYAKRQEDEEPVAGDPGFIPEDKPAPENVPMSPADLDDEQPTPDVAATQKAPDDRAKPFMRFEPSYYEKATAEQLQDQVQNRTGKKPHPRTKAPKLIAKLQELDKEDAVKRTNGLTSSD